MPVRILSLVLLSACAGAKWSIDTSDTSDVGKDTAQSDSGVTSLPPEARTISTLPWKPELLAKAGTTGGASQRGFWVNDVVHYAGSTDTYSHVYRIPWGADEDNVVAAADVVVATTHYTPRFVGVDGDALSLSGSETGSDDYEVYRLPEPNESEDLSDFPGLTLTFNDSKSTYWNQSGMMDANGDGEADDLVIAGHAGYGVYEGRIATILDAPTTGHLYSEDMQMVNACEDRTDSNVALGAMAVTPDADGSFWVTCASSNRATGYAEHRASLASEPDARVLGVSGWSAAPDPRGGVWLGAEGVGEVVYAHPDGLTERYAMDGFPFFGSDPKVVQVGDQIVLAVGALGTSEVSPSAVYLYDISESTDLDTLTSNRLEPEGNVLCLGGVNALVERSDGLYVASSGYLLDTQEGCGIQMWGIGIAP